MWDHRFYLSPTLPFQDKLREEASGAWDTPFHWQRLLNSIPWDSKEPGYHGDRDEPDTSEHGSENHHEHFLFTIMYKFPF